LGDDQNVQVNGEKKKERERRRSDLKDQFFLRKATALRVRISALVLSVFARAMVPELGRRTLLTTRPAFGDALALGCGCGGRCHREHAL
jgi:hypothetical protein